jgi:hypothetical protein
MFAYRYVPYLHLDSEPPVLPFVSFSAPFKINQIPTISMDMMESHWNEKKQFAFHLSYCDLNVYYFILPAEIDIPNTELHRRLRTEVSSDAADHHCDYYAKTIIKRFMERLTRRLHTQQHVRLIRQTIPLDPSTPFYYEVFLKELNRIDVSDFHDRPFLQGLIQEAQDIIDTEQRYRPGGEGFKEAQEHFESISDSSSV